MDILQYGYVTGCDTYLIKLRTEWGLDVWETANPLNNVTMYLSQAFKSFPESSAASSISSRGTNSLGSKKSLRSAVGNILVQLSS
jgi:hypothetical protein